MKRTDGFFSQAPGSFITRRAFAGGVLASSATVFAGNALSGDSPCETDLDAKIDHWQRETERVTPETYTAYLRDGDTRGLKALDALERGFDRVLREARETVVTDTPAVWSVYNMGYVVKTPQALFAIDLVHRRAKDFAPFLDFGLVTHNHGDHFHGGLYRELNGSGKTVISNFLDNYGAADWRKGSAWYAAGGFTRAEKTFRIRDVEIRTSLVDHNEYLVDFTTAFEIKVGDWLLYHSGDCGVASKLRTTWGRPDLWLFFPGCGVDVAAAVKKIAAKRVAFGHLWELAHGNGRLTAGAINAARACAASVGVRAEVPVWGDRIA